MNEIAAKQTFMVLYTAGLVFMLAGAAHLMEMKYGIFWGVTSFYSSWKVMNFSKRGIK